MMRTLVQKSDSLRRSLVTFSLVLNIVLLQHCYLRYSSMVCPTPNLNPHFNVTTKAVIGQISVLLDNNTAYTSNITIYPNPELVYLDRNYKDIKHIGMEDKILELKVCL